MSENSKVRDLLKRVQHPELKDTIKALEVRFDIDGLNYTEAANHLTSAVSKLSEYQTRRKVSAAHIRGGGNGGGDNKKKKSQPRKSILNANGSIFTGFYPNFYDFSAEE